MTTKTARELLLEKFAEPIKVLDHGHVRLVDVMGDDARIEEVARLSYSGARKKSETRGLLRYLMRHRHTSPFEQATITLDIKLPIFVARQLVRHRTQSLNEVSGRYSVLPEEFYVPDTEQICYQDANNKQGRARALDEDLARHAASNMRAMGQDGFKHYSWMLKQGISKETSRINLPLSTYTHWYATWDAHNLLHMLGLRLDSHAQWEIRVFAEAIAQIVKEWLPITWEAFEDYRMNAVTLSAQETGAVKHALLSLDAGQRDFILDFMRRDGSSEREIADFAKRFGLETT
jgi:thymidylate synthase (FAD)